VGDSGESAFRTTHHLGAASRRDRRCRQPLARLLARALEQPGAREPGDRAVHSREESGRAGARHSTFGRGAADGLAGARGGEASRREGVRFRGRSGLARGGCAPPHRPVGTPPTPLPPGPDGWAPQGLHLAPDFSAGRGLFRSPFTCPRPAPAPLPRGRLRSVHAGMRFSYAGRAVDSSEVPASRTPGAPAPPRATP